jgi:hypothetical protein
MESTTVAVDLAKGVFEIKDKDDVAQSNVMRPRYWAQSNAESLTSDGSPAVGRTCRCKKSPQPCCETRETHRDSCGRDRRLVVAAATRFPCAAA